MKRSRILLVLAALLLGACSSSDGAPATSAPQEQQLTPPTQTPGQAAPAILTEPADEAIDTLDSRESLSVSELHQRLDPFASATADCTLPCYNGLRINEATLDDVLNFYARLGIGPADLIPGDYDAVRDGTGRVGAWLTKTTNADEAEALGLSAPLVDVYVEDGAAQYVYIGWQYLPPYLTPSRVLEQMGQPDQLTLGLVLDEEPPAYALRLLYAQESLGFAFYGTPQGDTAQPTLCFSPDDVNRTFFGLFAPGVPPMEGLAYTQYLLPVEDALGLPPESFAEQVSGGCLTLTAEQVAQWTALGGE